MTAAQQRLISGAGSLSLVQYIREMREPIEEYREAWASNRRDHQVTVPVRVKGRCGLMPVWVMTEGLN